MSDLFISHAGVDSALARRVRDALRTEGYRSVFLDIDPALGITPFVEWESVLYRKLRACRAVIALCTDSFVASKWCFAELSIARSLERAVLPVVGAAYTGKASALPGGMARRQAVAAGDDDALLAAALARGLRELGVDPSPWGPWDPRRSPYPGLASHDASLAPVFCGREDEVQQGLQMLRGARTIGASRFIAIVGSSGTGKSSLMRAGILPLLEVATAEPWDVVVLQPYRPGRAPVSDLAAALARRFGGSWTQHRDRILADDAIYPLVQDLLRDQRRDGARVLLALDQFEEWLGGEPESDALLHLLRGAVDTDLDIVVLVTLRSDYLAALQSHPSLRGLDKRQLSVEPMSPTALRRAIAEPARIAGAELEDDLVERILADAASGPGVLPLVAFTLERLWEVGITPADRRLGLSRYVQIGGIGGAIRTRVAECLPADLPADEWLALRRKFQTLVDVDDAGRFRRLRSVWEEAEPAGRSLERLLQGRLLTVHRVDGQRVVEVAHEALFDEWERLRQWLLEDRDLLRFRAELAQAAMVWTRDGESAGDLWRGGRLQRAEELREAHALALEGLNQRFLEASLDERHREQDAERARRDERVRMGSVSHARGLAVLARDALSRHPQRALALAVEAVRATTRESLPPCPAAATALHALLGQVSGRPHRGPSRSAINVLVPSPDGSFLACAQVDGTVSVWPLRGGLPSGEPVQLGAHESEATAAVWHGGRLFTADRHGALARWHPAQPGRPTDTARAGAAIHHLAVDPRGRWLVAATGQELMVWPLDGGSPETLAGHAAKVRAIAFAPDGSFLLSSDFSGSLLAWSSSADAIVAQPGQWQAPDRNRIEAIAFDPLGNFFVTAGLEGVQLWRMSVDADDKLSIKVQALAGMPDYAVQVAVSPVGDVIVAQSYAGRGAAWLQDDQFRTPVDLGAGLRLPADPFAAGGTGLLTVARDEPRIDYRVPGQLREGLQALSLRGDDAVRPVLFLPHGSIAAGDDAGVLRCWADETSQPQHVWVSDGSLDLNQVAISSAGAVVLCAGERLARGRELDRRARLVDVDAGRVEVLDPFAEGVDAVALSADGDTLALASGRADEIVVIERRAGTRRAIPVDGGASCVALSADARWLAAGVGHAVQVWDLAGGVVRPPVATEASVIALSFDPRGDRLAASLAGGVLCLFGLRADAPEAALQRGLGDLVSEFAWSADGAMLVAAGVDHWQGMVWLCRADQPAEDWMSLDLGPAGRTMARMGIALSADGARLVAAGDGGNVARVFDLRDTAASTRDLRGHDQRIRDVAMSADGRCIATSSEDATVRLWDLDQPEPVVLQVVNGSAGRLAFRGSQLMAVSEAGAHRWNLDLDAVIALAAATASRNLSEDEWTRFLFGPTQATFSGLDPG